MSYFSLSTNIDVSMYFNDYKIQYCIATLPFIYAVAYWWTFGFLPVLCSPNCFNEHPCTYIFSNKGNYLFRSQYL